MRNFLIATIALLTAVACCGEDAATVGVRTEALDASAWNSSKGISVVDAPVVPKEKLSVRSADGASWFVSTLKNDKKVVSAKWMTAGLGVYELYLNGKIVGNDILKPGYTDPAKTKISFTYDISDAFKTETGVENTLAVQVTPGWWADRVVSGRKQMGVRGDKCAFSGVLELSFADGTKQLYGTKICSAKIIIWK